MEAEISVVHLFDAVGDKGIERPVTYLTAAENVFGTSLAFVGTHRIKSAGDWVRRCKDKHDAEVAGGLHPVPAGAGILACPNSERGQTPFFETILIFGVAAETRWRELERFPLHIQAEPDHLPRVGLPRLRRMLLAGIDLGRCICAWVEDQPNRRRLSYSPLAEQYPAHKLPGDRANPGIVHPLTWFRRDLAELLGGWDKVAATPAFEVSEYADGLLIQLVDAWFDDESADHRAAQIRAMEHLGFPWR